MSEGSAGDPSAQPAAGRPSPAAGSASADGAGDAQHPPIPPRSRRSQPRFADASRRATLASAFTAAGEDYDRLRPGYPEQLVDVMLAAAGGDDAEAAVRWEHAAGSVLDVVDLGAGTGKLALSLAARGARVQAVDPSASMLAVLAQQAEVLTAAGDAAGAGTVSTVEASAESSGLPDASADLVTAAQAWHWFDVEPVTAEVRRVLRPGGVLALLWNTLDVQIPWVHRFSRIMHAGDVQRDDFDPPVGPGLQRLAHHELRWEDPMPTHDLIDLARTRSYVITASEPTRAKVLANLDWYVHEHLGHEPGTPVGLPYRTDLFLYRAQG